MPYLYAHALHGLRAREQFPKKAYEMTQTHLDAFLLGLYGPDVYFGDRLPPPLFSKHAKPLGNELHALPGRLLFSKLFALTAPDDRAFSYALGFLCHFSLDNTMHPYIESRYRGNSHTRFEMRQDLLVRARSRDVRFFVSPNELYDTDGAVRMADGLHASLFFELDKKNTAGAYARSYKKWRRLQSLAYDPNGKKRRFTEGLERLLGRKRGTLSGFLLTVDENEPLDLFNARHKTWKAPWEKNLPRTESYFDLFDAAVADAVLLVTLAVSERQYGIFDEVLGAVGTRTMDGTNGFPKE